MSNPIISADIAQGVRFSTVQDKRFKTNRISINFFTPMKRETVTTNALVSQLLKKGYEGCENFTDFNRELENLYGASVEADIHKKGDYQVLTLAITTMDDRFALTNEIISQQAATILSKLAFYPKVRENGFDKKDVEIEKKALIDTIEAELNEKRIYAINSMNRLMCENEPYGLPRYGFVDDVCTITPLSALEQYKELLKTAQVEIMFVGCGNSSAAQNVFTEEYKKQNREFKALLPIMPHTLSKSQKSKTERMEVSQSKLVLGFSGEVTSKSELAPAMRMMVAVLGGTPSSKLFVNVREKMSLCYYCAARYDMAKGIMVIDSGIENENIEKAKSEILDQLAQVKQNNFTDEEINFARLSLKNTYSSVYESDCSIEAYYIGQLVVGLKSSPEEEKAKLDFVTREDIVKAANGINIDTLYLLTSNQETNQEKAGA